MSTKGTLKHEYDPATGQGFHLYEEMFEPGHVYLEVAGVRSRSRARSSCPAPGRTGS